MQQANLQQARRERDRIVPLFDQKLASQRDRGQRDRGVRDVAGRGRLQPRRRCKSAELESFLHGRARADRGAHEPRGPLRGQPRDGRRRLEPAHVHRAGGPALRRSRVARSRRGARARGARRERRRSSKVQRRRRARTDRSARKRRSSSSRRASTIPPARSRCAPCSTTAAERGCCRAASCARAIDGVSVPSSLVIPKRALMHGAQGPFVWVIGQGEQVAATPVAARRELGQRRRGRERASPPATASSSTAFSRFSPARRCTRRCSASTARRRTPRECERARPRRKRPARPAADAPTARKARRDLEFLHRPAAVRDGRLGVHRDRRARGVSRAAGRDVSEHRAAADQRVHGLPRRERGRDRRDGRGAARAGAQRRREHALHALGQLVDGLAHDRAHVRGRHERRPLGDQRAEPRAERAAAPARGSAPARRHGREVAAELPA